MKRKVYFAGSIRGGRQDAALYQQLIAYIGQRAEVLTEHVGDVNLSTAEQAADQDRKIYDQDTGWLRQCDLVIAEGTTPSLGVGYELAYAEQLGKPVYVLYRPDRARLSAMIKGDPYFQVIPYQTIPEACSAIDGILER